VSALPKWARLALACLLCLAVFVSLALLIEHFKGVR